MNNINADRLNLSAFIFVYSKANTIKLPYENHAFARFFFYAYFVPKSLSPASPRPGRM